MFSSIELETINRCNGSCAFCPVNKNADTREYKYMTDELFNKIIEELHAINYKGRLAFHSNNEPLLDKKISERIRRAREKLSDAYIYFYTNGSLLTPEKFEELIPHMDGMIIDNYNDSLELNISVKKIYELCLTNREYANKVKIVIRKINEVLTTRGGQAPNNTKKKTYNMSCVLPFKQIIIRPDGKLSLCCNDALGKLTMGDLNKNSLLEIWNSKRYKKIRKSLAGGRKNISICRYCDTFPGPSGY